MKNIKAVIYIVIITTFYACQGVTFTEPQPSGEKDLSKFSKHIIGNYISLDQSIKLTISKRMIEQEFDFYNKMHPNELDSSEIIKGTYVINLETNEKTKFTPDGDSLVFHLHYIDTIFNITNGSILRKYKGYYFLNNETNYGWEVQKLYLKKGKLHLNRISIKNEIEKLKKITETKEDSITSTAFSISKKQFKVFLKEDGFSDCETYMKIK